jgi:hypothetical protein
LSFGPISSDADSTVIVSNGYLRRDEADSVRQVGRDRAGRAARSYPHRMQGLAIRGVDAVRDEKYAD